MPRLLKNFREPFNSLSHFFGAAVALVLLVLLMIKASSDPISYKLSFLVYGVGILGMFLSSAFFHMYTGSEKVIRELNRIDHMMIFVMIAGTYTPVAAIGLEHPAGRNLLICVWVIAAIGIFKKTIWLDAPRWFSVSIFIAMGTIVVVVFPDLYQNFTSDFILWISIGGVFYIVGAIIYTIQKPNPLSWFGFHEIWHIFVLGGAFSHFWAIYHYLPGYHPL